MRQWHTRPSITYYLVVLGSIHPKAYRKERSRVTSAISVARDRESIVIESSVLEGKFIGVVNAEIEVPGIGAAKAHRTLQHGKVQSPFASLIYQKPRRTISLPWGVTQHGAVCRRADNDIFAGTVSVSLEQSVHLGGRCRSGAEHGAGL